MDDFQRLKTGQELDQFSDSEFRAFSPEQLRSFLDKEENDRLGGGDSFSMAEGNDSVMASNRSILKKNDCSTMNDYFQQRSSFPFPSLNGNLTLMESSPHDLPVQDKSHSAFTKAAKSNKHYNVVDTSTPFGKGKISADSLLRPPSKKSGRESFRSLDTSHERNNKFGLSEVDESEGNVSVSDLAQLFLDPEKSPMSSSLILNHVLKYCKENEGRKSKAVVHDIKTKRKSNSTNSTENFNELGKRLSLTLDPHRRSSVDYSVFKQQAVDNLFPSRCSTPDNISPAFGKSTASSESALVYKPFASASANSIVRRMPVEIPRNAPRASSSVQNLENTNPQPNSMVQVKVHVPTSSGSSMQQFPGPIVINITCPNAPNPPSSMARAPWAEVKSGVDARSMDQNSDNRVVGAENSSASERQPTDGRSQSKIHIQLSGTIEWST